MAQRTITRLVDDLDDTEIVDGAGQTINFALDGQRYEIDLTHDNAEQLRAALARYTKAARTVSARSTQGGLRPKAARKAARKAAAEDSYSATAVREWAKANKVKVSPRGRIPRSVIEQFRAAGN